MPPRLSIQLDRQDGIHRTGEVISGNVELVCPDSRRCDEIVLTLGWDVESPGEPHSVRGQPVVIAKQAQLTGGKPEVFRFELPAPPGPLTYHGHILSVHWMLRAEAKFGWALRERAETPISLVPWTEEDRALSVRSYRLGPVRPSLAYYPGPLPEAPIEKRDDPRGIEQPIVGVALAATTVALVVLRAGAFARVLALLLLVGGLSALFGHLRRRTLRERLGPPQLDVHPEIVRAGDVITVSVTFNPMRPEILSELTFSVHAQEVAARPSSQPDEPRLYRHSLHVERRSVDPERLRLEPARVTVIQEMFRIPETAAASFGAPHNELRWEVSATVRTPDLLTWKQSRRILVFPPAR